MACFDFKSLFGQQWKSSTWTNYVQNNVNGKNLKNMKSKIVKLELKKKFNSLKSQNYNMKDCIMTFNFFFLLIYALILKYFIFDCCKQSLTQFYYPPTLPPTHPSSAILFLHKKEATTNLLNTFAPHMC